MLGLKAWSVSLELLASCGCFAVEEVEIVIGDLFPEPDQRCCYLCTLKFKLSFVIADIIVPVTAGFVWL